MTEPLHFIKLSERQKYALGVAIAKRALMNATANETILGQHQSDQTILGQRQSDQPKLPPRGFWTDLLLPPDRAEDVVFNLLGRFDYWVERHGVRRARVIFAFQSFGCILSFWVDWLLQRLKLLALLRKP